MLENLDHPYKQIREQCAKLLVLTLRFHPSLQKSVIETLCSRMEGLVPAISAPVDSSEARLPEVLAASGLLLLLLHGLLSRASAAVELSARSLSFLLACVAHTDSEVRPLADAAFACLSITLRPQSVPRALGDLTPMLQAALPQDDARWSQKERQKQKAIEFLSLAALSCQFGICHDEEEQARLEAAALQALGESSANVRAAGKRLLGATFLLLEPRAFEGRIKAFRELAGPRAGTGPNAVAGVLGLATLADQLRLKWEPWAPAALVALAEYGGSKTAEVRKVVHSTLQNFFKAMQVDRQQWSRLQQRFTEEEMDTLELYKGHHSYFT